MQQIWRYFHDSDKSMTYAPTSFAHRGRVDPTKKQWLTRAHYQVRPIDIGLGKRLLQLRVPRRTSDWWLGPHLSDDPSSFLAAVWRSSKPTGSPYKESRGFQAVSGTFVTFGSSLPSLRGFWEWRSVEVSSWVGHWPLTPLRSSDCDCDRATMNGRIFMLRNYGQGLWTFLKISWFQVLFLKPVIC